MLLTRLPLELLDAIACELCSPTVARGDSSFHSHPGWRGPGSLSEDLNRLAALSRLSRTCKTLRDIAQPKLFRYVYPGRKYSSLLQTLHHRPDLARIVKEINLDGIDCVYEDLEADNKLTGSFLARELSELAQRSAPTESDSHGWDSDKALDYVATVALAQVPQIEMLQMTWFFSFHLHLRPESLPYLTELFVEHYDTESGFGMDDLQNLFAAAPSLKTFRGYMVRSACGLLQHAGLIDLKLTNSTLNASCFTAVMLAFPRMESFLYESGGPIEGNYHEATPSEISKAIHLRRCTLKHLSLDLMYADFDRMSQHDMMESLACMEVLETIEIDSMALYNHDDAFVTHGTLLVDFLPPNIRSLSISCPHENILPDIRRLVEEAPQKFPSFRKLSLPGISEDALATLTPAFVRNGIIFT